MLCKKLYNHKFQVFFSANAAFIQTKYAVFNNLKRKASIIKL